jgi:hypothetical protein
MIGSLRLFIPDGKGRHRPAGGLRPTEVFQPIPLLTAERGLRGGKHTVLLFEDLLAEHRENLDHARRPRLLGLRRAVIGPGKNGLNSSMLCFQRCDFPGKCNSHGGKQTLFLDNPMRREDG